MAQEEMFLFGYDIAEDYWREEWVGMPDFHVPTRDANKRNKIDVSDMRHIANTPTTLFPRYPIYIISKGRWHNPLTAKALEIM